MFSTLLPPEGAKTVWEDRCILVHVDNAKDVSTSPKLLPSVLLAEDLPADLLPQRAAVYPPDASGDGGEDGAGRSSLIDRLSSHLQAAMRPLALGGPITFIWSRFLSGCQPRAAAPPLEWHPRLPLLAAADSRGRVQLLDMGAALARQQQQPRGGGSGGGGGGGGGAPARGSGEVLAVGGPGGGGLKALLTNEALRHQALSLSWCPTSPGLLAVGSEGVVGLWAVAGEARPPLAAAGRAAGPWLRLLRTRLGRARVTSLSWSPDGRLLAAASPDQAGLQVWDVASGNSTPVGAGPAAFDTVRWSPCGNYVFAAGTGSRYFYIFETHKWRWARWQTSSGGAAASSAAAAAAPSAAAAAGGAAAASAATTSVVAAAWAPEVPGRNPILLAALSGQSYLVAVHLVESPPGLTAQLLPVALPELNRGGARTGGGGARSESGAASSSSSSSAAAVADLAWDPCGERLAVLLAPTRHPNTHQGQEAHCVAVYGTITDPLVSARLIGMARPSQQLCAEAAAAAVTGAAAAAAAAARAAAGADDAAAAAAAAGGEAAPAEAGHAQATWGSVGGGGGGAGEPGAASIVARPGALAVARLAPLAAGGGSQLPACVISARVGERGIYNLPCFL